MAELRITPRAVAELEEIWFYVAADRPTAADRLLEQIDLKILRLVDYPEIGAPRDEIGSNCRVLIHTRYLILYEYDRANDVVEVISVVDGARDFSQLF